MNRTVDNLKRIDNYNDENLYQEWSKYQLSMKTFTKNEVTNIDINV